MRKLTITYNGITLWDAEVDEFSWSEGSAGVTVQGKLKKNGGGLFDMLAANRRQQTAEIVAAKREEIHEVEDESA